MSGLAAIVLILGTAPAWAGNRSHQGTIEQQRHASEWNRAHALAPRPPATWDVAEPFAESENSGFVAISGDDNFELPGVREAIAKNLPAGVSLVIFVGNASDVSALKALYSQYTGPDQLKFLVTPMSYSADPIWARDSLPVPVHMKAQPSDSTPRFGLVDSRYPQNFEPDAVVSQALGLGMVDTGQYFRGGNMLADGNGNCFSENASEVANLSDAEAFFKNYFGCRTVTLLNHEGGIGDIDERIKFLGGMDVLTDNENYAQILASKGYTVHRIPSTGADMETYMNSLMVNGTVFVPQMGRTQLDADALTAYRAMGLTAVGVYTHELAVQGNGNIHCITMNYPPGMFTASPLGGDFVQFK